MLSIIRDTPYLLYDDDIVQYYVLDTSTIKRLNFCKAIRTINGRHYFLNKHGFLDNRRIITAKEIKNTHNYCLYFNDKPLSYTVVDLEKLARFYNLNLINYLIVRHWRVNLITVSIATRPRFNSIYCCNYDKHDFLKRVRLYTLYDFQYLNNRIGSGAFGDVHLVSNNHKKSYAVKISDFCNLQINNIDADQLREGAVSNNIAADYNLAPRIHEIYHDNDTVITIMDYYPGDHLYDVLKSVPDKKIIVDNVIDKIITLMDILKDRKHGDMAAHNILIYKSEIKFIDFTHRKEFRACDFTVLFFNFILFYKDNPDDYHDILYNILQTALKYEFNNIIIAQLECIVNSYNDKTLLDTKLNKFRNDFTYHYYLSDDFDNICVSLLMGNTN